MSSGLPPPTRRRGRPWLFAPAAGLALVLVGASGAWLWERGRLLSEMDARASVLSAQGGLAHWDARTVSGFPFRLKIVLQGVMLREAGEGAWGVSIPTLEAQDYVAVPTHWVFVAPQGLTLQRPSGGPVDVRGEALRASVAGIGRTPWRVVLEGVGLRFTSAPGGGPFSFASVDRLELAMKPAAPEGTDADVLLQMEGARPSAQALWRPLLSDAPLTLAATGRVTGVGSDGAVLHLDRTAGTAGALKLAGAGGTLGLDADGRVIGTAPLRLTRDGAPGGIDLPLSFSDGQARLGPLPLGPAWRVR
jgi:hypothetical protein